MNHNSSTRSIRSILSLVVFTAFLAAAPESLGQVDLDADSAYGPARVYVNTSVTVHVNVQSLGDPLVGDYTAEVILSNDLIVDAGDTVVATLDSDFYGLQTLVASIPPTMTSGLYAWGLRILPAAGEVNLANNAVLTDPVEVARTDLALDDPSPISVFVAASDEEAPSASVLVQNEGTLTSVLIFTVVDQGPAPWLTIDPLSSFAVSGQEGNEINLFFDHSQLPPGDYSTTIRFINYNLPSDFEDLEINLTVGLAEFTPGDRIIGQISSSGDTDRIAFEAVEGMRLVLKMVTPTGKLRPRILLFDPDGNLEKVLRYRHSKKFVKKLAKLKKTGIYTMEISGRGDTIGAYRIKTNRKLPKRARAHRSRLASPGAGGTVDSAVRLLSGATLDFSATPNKKFTGPLLVTFTAPGGLPYDIAPFSHIEDGVVMVEDLQLDELGEFIIHVSGYGADPKESVKLHVLPVQSPKGRGKVYLK